MDSLKRIKLKQLDKILFTKNLATLLKAGIPILEALKSVAKNSKNKNIKKISLNAAFQIEHGSKLNTALLNYKEIFDKTYITMVEAGEKSGALPKILFYLVDKLKKEYDLEKKFKQMTLYPKFLILIMFVAFLVFGGFVFPTLIDACDIQNCNIPISAKIIMGCAKFILKHWLFFLVGFISCLILIKITINRRIKTLFFNILFLIPKVKDLIFNANISRYAFLLQILYDSGVAIDKSLALIQNLSEVTEIQNMAKKAYFYISRNNTVSYALITSGIIPEELSTVITSAEESGKLSEGFKEISETLQDRVDDNMNTIKELFNPVVLVIISIAVGYLMYCFVKMYATAITSLI